MANETEIINDLWFKIHGLDEVNKTMKDMKEAMKDFNKECAIAEESASKVVKSFTTLGKMPMPMSNISPAVYSNRYNKQFTNVIRNTHATESHYAADLLNNPGIDYTAARTAWKAMEVERKKQQKVDEQMTNLKSQISSFLQDELKLTQDIVKEKQKQKERLMTENQGEKNERSKERNANSAVRNSIRDREEQRKRDDFDANRRSREFRNMHPELYVTGGQYFNARYQAANTAIGIGNAFSQFGGGGRALGLLFDTLGNLIRSPIAGTAAAITNLSTGVLELGKNATQAFAEIESIKTQLGVVFSNQTQADATFGQISQYAIKSPFGVQQTSELAILLKQSGVYASDLMNTLKMLGDTAGGNMEKMKRIANNYAQIVSIGKASMLDMRQFAYAGIPIFEAVSKELGVSQQELRKLISDGKVTSDIIEKVFKDLTGINGIFNEATSKGAKTLKARLQNLQDAKQLALASAGEWGVNIGRQTGGDSYAYRILGFTEDIYSHLQKYVSTINIQKDVKTIANRNNRIETLEKLIKETKDNNELRLTYEKELAAELAKRDVDAERNTFSASYDAKAGRLERALQELEGYSIDNAGRRVKQLGGGYFNVLRDIPSILSPFGIDVYSALGNSFAGIANKGDYSSLNAQESAELKNKFDELIKALDAYSKITAEDLKANRERNLLTAQQLAYDRMNSQANARGSLMNSFQELSSIYKNSDEYKQKEEEKNRETLKSALEVLKEIAKNTDEKGQVDITKFSGSQLYSYIQQGAFNATSKLDVVTGNNSVDKQNRELLMKQYGSVVKETESFLKAAIPGVTGAKGKDESFRANVISNLNSLSDEKFFDEFPKIYEKQQSALDELIKIMPDGRARTLQMYKELLSYALNRIETDTTGVNANPNAKANGEFIPLWKRILAQYTGLTTTGMTDTLSTLKNYRDDMAIRNLSAGVLSATLKENGLGAALGLIRGEGVSTLKGDTTGTIQTDWLATKQNLHDFALSLSSATGVVSAYKKGLEDELEVYQQLIVAGSTQGESQDANQQKYLTKKQLQKMKLSNAQLVNAFGDTLTTTGGSYKVSDLAVNDEGLLYIKSTGEIIKDQIKVESNLSRFLQDELPRLTKEIHEANAAELNNQYLNKQFNETVPTQLTSLLFGTKGVNDVTKFLANNSSYMMTDLKSALNSSRIGTRFADTATEDIIALGLKGRNKDASALEKEALALLIEALGTIIGDAKGVVAGDDEYERYGRNKKRDEALNDYLKEISNIRNNDWAKNLEVTPYNYSGYRGVSARLFENGFGLKQSFDIQDLYNQRASELGVDKLSFKDKLGISYGEKGLKDTVELVNELSASLETIALDFGKSSWVKPFETMAENLALGKDALDGMKDVYKGLTAEMLNASGAAMQKAGWELVAMGAADRNVGMIAGGLALAAAGGAAAGLGNALNNTDKDDSDDKTKRLEDLKDDLADLLRQARNDAIYYENTLRHKKAISANNALTTTSVHDAVITPSGQVVKTDPKDYLLATKTPKTLVGGGSPTINFNVIDKSTGIRVAEQRSKYNPETNTLEFTALIENKVKEVIATSAGDDAFAARAARQQGRIVIA